MGYEAHEGRGEICCFCGQAFASAAKKNEHILSHFERKHCFGCDRELISIADTWYQLHIDGHCDGIKLEPGEPTARAAHHFDDFDGVDLTTPDGLQFDDALDMMDPFDPLDESAAAFDDFNFDDDLSEPSLPDVSDIGLPIGESEVWRCRICSKTFTYRHNLMRHYRNVERIEPTDADMGESATHQCHLCPQAFAQKSMLTVHQLGVHNAAPNAAQSEIVLAQQDETLPTATDLNENEAKPSTSVGRPIAMAGNEVSIKAEHATATAAAIESPADVDDDDDDLLQPIDFKEPEQQPTSPRLWSCKICLKTFTFRNNLSRHLRKIKCSPPAAEQQPKGAAKPWRCDRCPQAFTLQQNLHRHRKNIHQIEFKPSAAADGESSGGAVASTAAGSPPIKHEPLDRGGAAEPDTGDLSCRKCLKTFTLRSNLVRHLRNVKCVAPEPDDVDEPKNAWFCDSCPQSFTAKSNLVRHQRKFHAADSAELADIGSSATDVESSDEYEPNKRRPPKAAAKKKKAPLWQCDICSKTFTLPNNLHRHKQDIHKVKFGKRDAQRQPSRAAASASATAALFSCDICLKTFTFRNNLSRHNRNIECRPPSDQPADADGQQWICDYCACAFAGRDDILTHMRRAHPDMCMVDCDICSLPFLSMGRLETHMLEKHRVRLNATAEATGFQVTCNYCAAVFPRKMALDTHKRDQHADRIDQDGVYKCSQCPALFGTNAVRKTHLMRMHKQPTRVFKRLFKCYVCAETFKFPGTVVGHLAGHNISGDYRCCFEPCDARIDSAKRLYYHLQKHLRADDEKRKCDKCQRSYSMWTFDTHRCGSSSALAEFMCHYCGKTCATKYMLKQHLHTHTGAKPYKCQYCPMAFNNSYTRNRHQNTHTGKKPCKCTVAECGRAFGQHIDLYRHLYKVHGIYKKKYPCAGCAEVFPENSLLKKHRQLHGCN